MEKTGKKLNPNLKKTLIETGVYLGLFLLALVCFWGLKPFCCSVEQTEERGMFARAVGVLAFVGIGVAFAVLAIKKQLSVQKIVFLLLLLGLVLRLAYMLYTPANMRQQDTYTSRDYGHESYAWLLFSKGKMPSTNDYQFYHPPLNALLQAGCMKIVSFFTDGLSKIFTGGYFPSAFAYKMPNFGYMTEERYYLYSSCMTLSFLYSGITAVILLKTLNLFSFSPKTKLLLSAFVILYPRHIQFAGQLNNDPLAYLFSVLALYYALKWWKGNKSVLWIFLCALAVGLGMMAKLSSATVCLPIAGIFLWEFVRTLRKEKGSLKLWKMVLQYGGFLCICAPIGLWFQVYAKLRFDQNFGFVFSNLNHKLYTGDHSLFERFIFPFDFTEFFGSLYCRPFEGNYYLFNYALRSSIFGEFTYASGGGFGASAVLLGFIGVMVLVVAIGYGIVLRTSRKTKDKIRKTPSLEDMYFVVLLILSQTLSLVYFYVQMPYGCTMDFRYIMPLILGLALLVGFTDEYLVSDGGKASLAISYTLRITCVSFLTVSALFYCACI